jgi:hypothetical protein
MVVIMLMTFKFHKPFHYIIHGKELDKRFRETCNLPLQVFFFYPIPYAINLA